MLLKCENIRRDRCPKRLKIIIEASGCVLEQVVAPNQTHEIKPSLPQWSLLN